MTILENTQKTKSTRIVRRNFDGVKLLVHRLKYTLDPGAWDNETRTAFIIGEDFKSAERLLIENMPPGKRWQIDEMGDSVFEIHALTPEIKRRLYNILKPEYENEKEKLSDRLRK